MYLKSLIYSILIISALTVGTTSGFSQLTSNIEISSNENVQIEFNLQELTPDWANLIEDNPDTLESNLQFLITALRGVTKQYKEKSDLVIQSINQYNSLLVRHNKEKLGSEEVIVKVDENQKYSLDNLLKLKQEQQKLGTELEMEKSLLDSAKIQYDEAKSNLTNVKSQYLELEKSEKEKIPLALEWIQSWIKLRRLTTELEIKKIQQSRDDNRLKLLNDQLQTGKTNLIATNKEISDEFSFYNKIQNQLNIITKKISDVQNSYTNEENDSNESRMKYRLQSQTLIKLNGEKHLYELMLNVSNLRTLMFNLVKYPQNQNSKAIKKELETSKAITEEKIKWLTTNEDLTNKEEKLIENLLNSQNKEELSQDEILKERKKIVVETFGIMSDIKLNLDMVTFLSETLWDQIIDIFGDTAAISASLQNQIDNTWGVFTGFMTSTLFEVNQTPISIIDLIRLLVILLITWAISKIVRKAILSVSKAKSGMNIASLQVLSRIINYFILTTGFIIGLSSIGIDVTKFALIASALSVGIGFGMQNMINNFVSGLMLLFERSLKVGDFVELESGVSGEVSSINMRSTVITTNDNIDIVVPNSEFVNGRVTNWTMREAVCRVHIPFGVAYGTDKKLVQKAVLEAADRVSFTLKDSKEREPQVWMVSFGDSSLNFELVVWLKSFAVKFPAKVKATYVWEIESSLSEYNIEIPFPQRDLHIKTAISASKFNENVKSFADINDTKAG